MTTPEPDRWNLQALRDLGRLPAEDAADYRLARAIAYQERLEVRERALLAREVQAEGEARTLLAWQNDLKAQQAGLRSWRRGLWWWTAGVVVVVFWVLVTCAGTLPAGGRP